MRLSTLTAAALMAGLSSIAFAQGSTGLQLDLRPTDWDPSRFQQYGIYTEPGLNVNDIAVNPETGAIIAGYSDGLVRVFTEDRGMAKSFLYTDGNPWTVAVMPGTDDVLVGGSEGGRVFEVPTGFQMRTIDEVAARLGLSPSGRLVAIATGYPDYDIVVRELETGNLVAVFDGHSGYISQMQFSADEAFLFSASGDGSIRRWDLATGEVSGLLGGHQAGVQDFAIAPDGLTSISGSIDRTARVWDMTNGAPVAVLGPGSQPVGAVAVFEQDGATRYVTADLSGFLRVWSVENGTGTVLAEIQIADPAGGDVAGFERIIVAPDERHILAGQSNGVIAIITIADDDSLRVTADIVPIDRVDFAVLLPNGNFMASDAGREKLRLPGPDGTLVPIDEAYRAAHEVTQLDLW